MVLIIVQIRVPQRTRIGVVNRRDRTLERAPKIYFARRSLYLREETASVPFHRRRSRSSGSRSVEERERLRFFQRATRRIHDYSNGFAGFWMTRFHPHRRIGGGGNECGR